MSTELECGSRVGEWELTERIGEGGGGHVWRARGPEGDVALKVIAPELVEHEEVRARFLREVKAIRLVGHPNVVRYLDAGEIGGELFMVMELLDGESLETRLATVGRLPAEEVIRIGCEIASGLGAVHAAGIVHRDMKPTNIQLCGDGVAKLIDFGIAKWTDTQMDLTQMTRTGHIMGTPNYMAPEQASALRDESERTDVWGLAATLYDATVGHPPFGRDDPPLMAMMGRILTMDPVEMPDDVPPALRSALLQALEKDPDKRFQTMAAFARALSPAVPAPMEVAEVGDMSPAHVTALPFVARKREMMLLGGALMAAASNEESVALLIEAEEGMGKSRMLVELRAWAVQRLDRPRFLEARAESTSALRLMRSLLDTEDFDQDGIHEAVRELLGAWCAVGPVVALVDDLNLADDATLAMLDRLLAEVPLILVGSSRLGDDGWAIRHPRLAAATRVKLTALDDTSVRKLVKAVAEGVSDDVVERIVARAAGNPQRLAQDLQAAHIEALTAS